MILIKWQCYLKKKLKCCKKNSFLSLFKQTSMTLQTHLYSWQCHLIYTFQKMKWDRWLKADKVSDILNILNRVLQTDLAKLISALMSLFNACIALEYYLKQFKKIQMIVLWKSKKSDLHWFKNVSIHYFT